MDSALFPLELYMHMYVHTYMHTYLLTYLHAYVTRVGLNALHFFVNEAVSINIHCPHVFTILYNMDDE